MPFSAGLTNLVQAASATGRVMIQVSEVHPSALPYLAATLERDTGRHVAVVTRDMTRARFLHEEIRQLVSGGEERGDVLLLPTPYVSPYMDVSVDSRLQAQCMGTLARLMEDRGGRVLVLPAAMLAAFHVPLSHLRSACRVLERGQEFDRERFLADLADAGYVRVSSVAEPGTFAVRGSLVDIYSPGELHPVRVDFFGDEVESLSTFDLSTQLSTGKVPSAHLVPATPALSLSGMLARSRKELLELSDSLNHPAESLSRLTEALRSGELPAWAEPLMPLLAGGAAPVTEYLPPARWVILFDDRASVLHAIDYLLEGERPRHAAAIARGRLVLPPSALFASSPSVREALRNYTRVNAAALDPEANLRVALPLERPLSPVTPGGSRLSEFEARAVKLGSIGFRTAATAVDAHEADRLVHLLTTHGLPAVREALPLTLAALSDRPARAGVRVFVSGITAGVHSEDMGLLVATAADLFDKKAAAAPQPAEATASQRERLLELEDGDFVVHRDFGVARFSGVERRKTGAGEYMCLKLVYQGGDVLYVPVHNAGGVSKYVGAGGAAPKLDKLGGSTWASKLAKARSGARKLAINLLELYARRVSMPGFAFSSKDDYFEEFEARFPYEETPDQASAIADVQADMEKPVPMDRLVCGDVGFGKTEVAIRAAFKAVLDGRQVAVLVPTTVLCEQHRVTFEQRLKEYPVVVESLSRFKGPADQKAVLQRLAGGKTDIVIGTHRLLSKDVQFKNLGLLVVDEEHRFGVAHKEKLKALRTTVDVLSLTATPIPRTLHMAMSGIRDLSVIKTPPAGRLDIQTFVVHHDPGTLKSAIDAEISRGGQVFFLHNRVEDILTVREQLEELVPGIRIGVGHGQMAESALEKVMVGFVGGRYDLLLCTTIIESGLDLPNVNTLIVNNAHAFGLAQLYQIRGRVGRGHRQAYAYFVVPPTETLPTEARLRLATLAKFTSVGSGLHVASIDMELRGAGDILGADQSGQVNAVGFEVYVHLLHDEVDRLKARQEQVPQRVECQVDVAADVAVPEEYIADRHQRLVFYRMAATAETPEAVERLRFETRDRFGPMPESVSRLLSVAEIRVRAGQLAISRLEVVGGTVRAHIGSCPDNVLQGVLALIREQPLPVRLTPDHVLHADLSKLGAPDPVARARRFLNTLERAVVGR